MGVFYEHTGNPQTEAVRGAIRTALMAPPPTDAAEADAEAEARATGVAAAGEPPKFQPGRFFAALLIVAALLAVGALAEWQALAEASKTSFALATTLFGVVVGLLGGERATT